MAITLAKLGRDIRRLRGAAARHAITPWQAGRQFLRLYCKDRYSPDEIFMLGLLDPTGTGGVIVSKERLLALQLALSPSGQRHLLDDKLAFHRHCAAHGLAAPTLLATYGSVGVDGIPHLTDGRDWEAFWRVREKADVVIKPVDGVHGRGVRRMRWNGGTFHNSAGETLSLHALRSLLDTGEDRDWLIQETLRGHCELQSLSATDSVQTLRVVSYVGSAGEVEIMAAWLRIIASRVAFDNFDRGRSGNAVGVVDTEGGAMGTVYRMDPSGLGLTRLDRHPLSGYAFDGFVVPQWGAVRRLVLAAAAAFHPLRTIGWDVAVTDAGPVLIEGNHTWGPLPGNPGMGAMCRRLEAAATEATRARAHGSAGMSVRGGGRRLWRASVAGALFPLHERLKGHDTVAKRRELERTQWLGRNEIEALRVERLRVFLGRVGERVPYYQDLFHALDFRPGDVSSIDDLAQLPLLDKPAIRSLGDALRARDARRLRSFNTGGSTGEPLVFWLSPARVSHDVAAKWRATRWWGVDVGDPEVVLWGSPLELGAQDRLKGLRDRLLRSRLLPAFAMSVANMDAFLETIRRTRPRILFGYPSALALLAGRARQRGLAMDALGIRVAFVTGERLYDEQRALLAEVFGCAVANGYGGRDAGFIAHECPAGGMHLSAEDIIVETVDAEGRRTPPGGPGELVVTHLATADFPFIRYRTGDVGVLEERSCPCGRGLPLLGEIQGRDTDFVVAVDGTAVHGLALIYTVREQPGVHRFRIVQESLRHIRVEVVPDARWSGTVAQDIRDGMRRRLGETVDVQVVPVDDIPPERSGKYRYVVSRVRPDTLVKERLGGGDG